MYFQLLHTKVDFQNTYNVYLDIKDTCSSEKLETLNRIMSYNSSIGRLQFIRSHESVFIQLSDVLMGAINYNLRIEKGDVQGKVIAKRKLIDKIKKHSNISLSTTTPLSRKKFNLFFISLNYYICVFNILKVYPELLDIICLSERDRHHDLQAIFKRDIEDNSGFAFRSWRSYPIKAQGEADKGRMIKHMTCEEIIED